MQYQRAYQFILDSKNWFMNVLMGVVCGLIPILGDIVFHGYLFEIIDALHEDPDHRDYPDFDFNRFMAYLMRGLWPFLAQLIFGLVVALPLVLLAEIPLFVGIFAFRQTPALIVACVGLFVVLILGLSAVLTIVEMPLILHAGLARELRFKEMLAFARDFVKRMWKEELFVVLFMMVTGMALSLVGMCAFFVGFYFAVVAINMAFHHLLFQMYELYLKRGGSPIRRAGESEVGTVEAV